MKSRDKDNPTGVRTANNGNFAQRLEPSADQSTSNTITSVAKDNLLIEPYDCIYYNQSPDFQRPPLKNIGRTVKADSHQPAVAIPENQGIRIRRLTERELYRLMDVSETDIDTLLAAPIPRTQHAKLAGNSIVVACLYHIFRNLFVTTEPEAGIQTTLF
jgi:site-specific DNA-cytosine methylase